MNFQERALELVSDATKAYFLGLSIRPPACPACTCHCEIASKDNSLNYSTILAGLSVAFIGGFLVAQRRVVTGQPVIDKGEIARAQVAARRNV